ncbi:MAG: InlB B-repeat-containing protein [Butyrivibrio sp.]|nr:InlB B-repeat-containing protein [Butyrivibrio sp.]
MRKRHLGRLLSAALSATLAFTSVIPSYAMEGIEADEISEAQEESELEEEPAENTAEETEEPEEDLAAASAGSEEEEEVLIEEDENEELAGGFRRVEIYISFTDVANSYITNNYDQTLFDVEDTATFELNHPEKEGHTFDVWDKGDQENVTVGTKGEEKTPITVSGINEQNVNNQYISLTAKWILNKYKVVYDANGGSGDAMDPEEDVAYDTKEVKIKDNAFKAPKGRQFVKWNTAPDGTGVDKAPGDSAGGFGVENGGTVTLYAQWEFSPDAQTYKVALNPNCEDVVEGLPSADENDFVGITVYEGGKYTGLPKLSRKGYVFEGWYTQKQRGTQITPDSEVEITSDTTLYAQWSSRELDLDFNANSYDAYIEYFSKTVKYGTKVLTVVPKVTASPMGYKFDGWYASKDEGTGELSNPVDENTLAEDNTTYFVKWAPIKYTIKFDANGGKGTLDDQEREYDDHKELPDITGKITREHYTFTGWNDAKEGGILFYNKGTGNATYEDGAVVTLYAQWRGDNTRVEYDYGYGDLTSTDFTWYGSSYPTPKEEYLAGHPGFYFEGWYNGDTKVDITKEKVTEDITLTAKWTKVTYKATFNSNNSKKKTTKKPVVLDETKTEPMAFTDFFEEADAAGQVFDGWATDTAIFKSLSQAELIDALKGDKTSATKEVSAVVYAQWAAAGRYNIKLRANLPTASKPEDLRVGTDGQIEAVNFAEPFFLTGSEFRLDGYTLTGWTYKNAKGKTVTLKPAAKLVNLTKENDKTIEISAKWKATSYTLKYDLNGGSVPKKTATTVKYSVNDTTRKGVPFLNYKESEGSFVMADVAEQTVKRRGYKFLGWDVEGGYYGKDRFSNMTVKAIWDPNPYMVRLDPNGGELNGSTDVFEDFITIRNAIDLSRYTPVKKGYTLSRWTATTVDGKTKTYKPSAVVWMKDLAFDEGGQSFTLKAKYTPDSNKLVYNLYGGSINKKAPKTYVTDSDKNKAIPVPVKAGHTFLGWNVYNGDPDKDGVLLFDAIGSDNKIKSGLSGTLYLNAAWDENKYNIEFYSNDGKTAFSEAKISKIGYSGVVNFTDTAVSIEATDGFSGSIKGFATSAKSKKVSYELRRDYSKIGGKAKDGETIKLYVVGQAKVYRITYDLNGGTLKNALYEYKTPTAKAGLKLKTTATKKGFTFKGFTCADEESVVTNKDGYVTAIRQGAKKDLTLTAVFDNEVSYTITAMPNAGDVVDKYDKVDAKKGVAFEFNGKTKFPISNKSSAKELNNYLGWSRQGYEFKGFATDKNGKNMIKYLGGLPYNKKNEATVYAIWSVNSNTLVYHERGYIYRDGVQEGDLPERRLGVKFSGTVNYKYGKEVTLKKAPKATGFTFKGWKVLEYYSDKDFKVIYTDKTRKFVKAIAKDNTAKKVVVAPVYEMNYRNLYVNPNGGTYKGSKKKQFVRKIYYTYGIPYIDDDLSRSGYEFDYLSTTKNAKGKVTSSEDLFKKSKTSVTLNVIWRKVSIAKPTVAADIFGKDMSISLGAVEQATSRQYYEIQYSTNVGFTYNVKTITLKENDWTGGKLKSISATVVPGKDYYLRARMLRKDSTGGFTSGAWSTVARASRNGDAVATGISVKTAPKATAYKANDFFDPTGLEITVTMSDDSTKTVAYNEETKDKFSFSPSLTTALKKSDTTVTISYGELTTTQAITVRDLQTYIITFNANGGKFTDGTTIKNDNVNEGENYPAVPAMEVKLEKKTFKGWALSATATEPDYSTDEKPDGNKELFAVWADRKVSSIAITANPEITEIPLFISVDPSGMEVTATFDNGETESIADNLIGYGAITLSPASFEEEGRKTVTVTYQGKSATFEVNVYEPQD